jgi:hypothetical protein
VPQQAQAVEDDKQACPDIGKHRHPKRRKARKRQGKEYGFDERRGGDVLDQDIARGTAQFDERGQLSRGSR